MVDEVASRDHILNICILPLLPVREKVAATFQVGLRNNKSNWTPPWRIPTRGLLSPFLFNLGMPPFLYVHMIMVRPGGGQWHN